MQNDKALRQHLISLLDMKGAHVGFDRAVRGWPLKLQGKKPRGAPYSAWQLLEHMRLAQWDILDFCRNPNYKEKNWPDDYWPQKPVPPDDQAWQQSCRAFRRDLKEMKNLVANPKTNLFAKIPWGSGQTCLREALLVADHNSHHLGQLILLRRLLGDW